MKKLIALVLVIATLVLTLTGCLAKTYSRGDSSLNFEFGKNINAKVIFDSKSFNKNEVSMDFLYSLYSVNNITLEQAKGCGRRTPSQNGKYQSNLESVYAIYLSNSENLIFEEDNYGALIDYENGVNAQLLRFIDYEEAFSTNYGYTSHQLTIKYNHSEKITIPAELFNSINGVVYIHIINFVHDIDNNKYYNDNVFEFTNISTVKMKYYSIGDMVIII